MDRKKADKEILGEINARLDTGKPAERVVDISNVIKQIYRAAAEVSSGLGSGFKESVYQNALMVEFKKEKLDARANVPVKVLYNGFPVGEYTAHIIVESQIIIDVTMVDELERIHEIQLLNCLRATGYKIGFLINFANEQAEIRRFSL